MTLKLILINGPAGVGKSTISARLHAELPNSSIVDIDDLRRKIPDYRERREESLRLSYENAETVVKNTLSSGRSVIIDKAIFDTSVLDTFIEIGKNYNAQIWEFLLFAEKETLIERAEGRGYRPNSLLTPERVVAMWNKADILRQERAGLICINTTQRDAEQVFQQIKQSVMP
ncbi:MAG: AAA family ATPase [bacterium]|nr:AAA family ATPase [bacterium]